MKGFLKIKTEEEFEAWLASNAPAQDGGGDSFWN
jgi:heme/copper-type cytochrome/quinol oxidase subunit 2